MSRWGSFLSSLGVGQLSPLADRAEATLHQILGGSAALAAAFFIGLAYAYLAPVRPAKAPSALKDQKLALTVAGWVVGTLGIACLSFWVAYRCFVDAAVAPGNAYEIRATSSKGRWTFEYPNGKISLNLIAIPRSQPVKLSLSSADEIHELYLPRLHVRQTAIPGRYTSTWFQSNQVLSAPVECVTFCPRGQVTRVATLRVLEPPQFDIWLSETGKQKDPSNRASRRGNP